MVPDTDKKLNKNLNLLSFIVLLLVCMLTVNMSLVSNPTLFAVLFFAVATASAWLSTAKGTILSITAAFVGWTVSLILTESPVYALISISYLPISLALGSVSICKLSRSVAVAVADGAITLGTITTLLYVTYSRVGEISLSSIRAAFPFFFEQVSEILYNSFFVSVAGSKVSLIAESNVLSYINLIICLIPAAFSALITVVGFAIEFLHRKLCEITTVASFKYCNRTTSIITALFFIFALIVVLIFDEVSLVSLSAISLALLILPFIILSGLFTSFSPKEVNGTFRPRFFRPLTIIISLFNGIAPFISLCVFYGLFDSIRASVSQRNKKNQD